MYVFDGDWIGPCSIILNGRNATFIPNRHNAIFFPNGRNAIFVSSKWNRVGNKYLKSDNPATNGLTDTDTEYCWYCEIVCNGALNLCHYWWGCAAVHHRFFRVVLLLSTKSTTKQMGWETWRQNKKKKELHDKQIKHNVHKNESQDERKSKKNMEWLTRWHSQEPQPSAPRARTLSSATCSTATCNSIRVLNLSSTNLIGHRSQVIDHWWSLLLLRTAWDDDVQVVVVVAAVRFCYPFAQSVLCWRMWCDITRQKKPIFRKNGRTL